MANQDDALLSAVSNVFEKHDAGHAICAGCTALIQWRRCFTSSSNSAGKRWDVYIKRQYGFVWLSVAKTTEMPCRLSSSTIYDQTIKPFVLCKQARINQRHRVATALQRHSRAIVGQSEQLSRYICYAEQLDPDKVEHVWPYLPAFVVDMCQELAEVQQLNDKGKTLAEVQQLNTIGKVSVDSAIL
jgi:hypothetical protein